MLELFILWFMFIWLTLQLLMVAVGKLSLTITVWVIGSSMYALSIVLLLWQYNIIH